VDPQCKALLPSVHLEYRMCMEGQLLTVGDWPTSMCGDGIACTE